MRYRACVFPFQQIFSYIVYETVNLCVYDFLIKAHLDFLNFVVLIVVYGNVVEVIIC